MSSEERLLKDLCKNTEHIAKAVTDLTKGVRKINTVLGEMQKLEKQKARIYHQDDTKITYGGCTNCEHCWDCPDAFTEQAVSCYAYDTNTDCYDYSKSEMENIKCGNGIATEIPQTGKNNQRFDVQNEKCEICRAESIKYSAPLYCELKGGCKYDTPQTNKTDCPWK